MRSHFNRPTALLFILPALFGLVGLCLLALAIWLGYQSWGFLHAAKSAPGCHRARLEQRLRQQRRATGGEL